MIANNNSNNLSTSAFGAQDIDTNATGISYRQYGNNHTFSNIDNISPGDTYYQSKHAHRTYRHLCVLPV